MIVFTFSHQTCFVCVAGTFGSNHGIDHFYRTLGMSTMECQCCISFHLVCHVMGMHRPVWHRGAVLFLPHTHMDRIYQTRSPMVATCLLCADSLRCGTDRPYGEKRTDTFANRHYRTRVYSRWACALRTRKSALCHPSQTVYGELSSRHALSQQLCEQIVRQ